MKSIMEWWVQTCRRELLDRTLTWNQAYLLHALREFEQFYNCHRPHQGIANARPLRALPAQIPGLAAATRLHVASATCGARKYDSGCLWAVTRRRNTRR